jgi:hypothetical protein
MLSTRHDKGIPEDGARVALSIDTVKPNGRKIVRTDKKSF